MKTNESIAHYIWLFTGFAIFFLVTFAGWELSEHFIWFAEVWEHMPTRIFITFVGSVGTIVLLAYIKSYFWGPKKFTRSFKELTLTKLDKCKNNELVRIQGKIVLLEQSLVAPFSSKKCAVYDTKAFEKKDVATLSGNETNVGSKTIWQTIKQVKEARDFLVQCKGSYALIRVAGSKIKLHKNVVYDEKSYVLDRGGFLTDQENTRRRETLERIGSPFKKYIGAYANDIKFEEGVLEQGEQVAIRGVGKWIALNELSELVFLQSEGTEKVFEISHMEESPLHISDSQDVLEQQN